jgi:hypothetical protein
MAAYSGLTKRLESLEAGRNLAPKEKRISIFEKIALYEKYFSGELPVPEDLQPKWDEWQKLLCNENDMHR